MVIILCVYLSSSFSVVILLHHYITNIISVKLQLYFNSESIFVAIWPIDHILLVIIGRQFFPNNGRKKKPVEFLNTYTMMEKKSPL